MIQNVSFQRVENFPDALFPKKKYSNDSSFVFFVAEKTFLLPELVTKVRTGIRVKFPSGYQGQLNSLSELVFKNQILTVSETIEEEYEDEIIVGILNLSSRGFYIEKGMAITQMKIERRPELEITYLNEKGETINETSFWNSSYRRNKNFGSSDE